VPYSPVVFTLPHELIPLALQNPKLVYGLFFRAVSQALWRLAADPRHRGAQLGFLAVLHTWNQQLRAHPHIHCLVPAGGLSADQTRWISCRYRHFFLPVKALGALCRGQFLALLRRAFRKGKLRLSGALTSLQSGKAFDRFTCLLKNKEWVVYAKKPFRGPQYVIKYLAHYTHRVAMSNGRLLRFENGEVTFRWRDSAHGNQQKVMTLPAVEFMRRFLLPVLPRGFVKIRHFGYLTNRRRKSALALCRRLLRCPPPTAAGNQSASAAPPSPRCPHCPTGQLVRVARLSPLPLRLRRLTPSVDTS
jgi:hypothetical protein